MEVVKGTASSVRYTVHVSGDKNGVSTRHHAIFKVGETTVLFDSGAPPVIGEGDRLVVAGRRKGRHVLLCDAYKNTSAGILGDSGLLLNFAGMLLFFLFGAVGFGWLLLEPVLPWLPRLDKTLAWFVAACATFFTCWGGYYLYKWLRIRGAVRLVRGG